MIAARRALRDGTLALHKRVDALFSRWDLSRVEDYRKFLSAQAAAFVPAEEALDQAGAEQLFPGWLKHRRSGLLQQDLVACGVPVQAPAVTPVFATSAAIWGGIYVLEGSRLGGALLSRSVASGLPATFLRAEPQPAGWRNLLQLLDDRLVEAEDIALATTAAQQFFLLFEQAGRKFARPDEQLPTENHGDDRAVGRASAPQILGTEVRHAS